jgi:predicted MFS family arabinose efflux permease
VDPEPRHQTGAVSSRWHPIAGFVLVASANQMLWLNFTPITTGAATHLAVSKSAIGTLSEIFPLLYVLLALPVGRALDRWFRPTLGAGAALQAGGALLRLGGHGYAWVLIGQVLIAVAQPAILNAITGTASRYLHEEHRPLGIAVASAGTFLGFILAFVLGGVFGAGRLHTILVISAVYTVVAAGAMAATLRPPTSRATGESDAGADADSDTEPDSIAVSGLGATPGALRELWGDPVMRTLSLLVFGGFGVFIALTTWVETLLKPAGVSSGHTDVLLAAMVVAGLVGSVLIPPLAAERGLQAQAILASGCAIVAGCVLLAAAPGVATAAVAMIVMGFLVLPDLPVILELAERRAGAAGGTATAMLWLAGNAGGIVVALIVQGVQGSPALAFAVMALIGCLAAPLALRLRTQLRT